MGSALRPHNKGSGKDCRSHRKVIPPKWLMDQIRRSAGASSGAIPDWLKPRALQVTASLYSRLAQSISIVACAVLSARAGLLITQNNCASGWRLGPGERS